MKLVSRGLLSITGNDVNVEEEVSLDKETRGANASVDELYFFFLSVV